MKKLFTWVMSIMLCLSTIIGSFTGSAAKTFDDTCRTLFQKAETYFSNASSKEMGAKISQADTLSNADADVQRMIWEISNIDADFGEKVSKLFDFWEYINVVGGTTNVYEPNADYTINEEDMITTFTNDDTVAIFMYGNAMQADGSMSEENIGRCNTVLALAQQYPNAYIILSGGHTQSADKKHSSEAKYVPEYDSEAGASYKYLTQTALQPTYMDGTPIEGAEPVLEEKYIDENRPTIDPSRIILDERAQDTVGNINYSMAKLENYPQINKFIAVTSDYHIARASVLLMAYIYLYGLDVERDYSFEGFVGWAKTPAKTEQISMTIMSLGSIIKAYTGDNGSWSAASTTGMSLSTPETITPKSKGYFMVGNDDLTDLFTSVDVTFEDVEGFVYDAKEHVTVEGFDPNKCGEQEFTVIYEYNDVKLEADCSTIVVKDVVGVEVNPKSTIEKGVKSGADLFESVNVTFITEEEEEEQQTGEPCATATKDVEVVIDIKDSVDLSNYDEEALGYQNFALELAFGDKVFEEKVTIEVTDEYSTKLIQELIKYFTNLEAFEPGGPGPIPGPATFGPGSFSTPQNTVGKAAAADVERKLRELEAYDYNLGQRWRKLIENWTKINADNYVNEYTPKANYSVGTRDLNLAGVPNDATVAIFMYGNAMQKDGTMSEENIARCNTVLALAQKYPNAYIILSGGHTQADDRTHSSEAKYEPEYDSEASASYKYLTQKPLQPTYMDGTPIEDKDPEIDEEYFIDASRPTINPDRIILDERALDTVGNIKYSMELLEDYPDIKYFITVTSAYHIPRATLALEAYIDTRGLDYEIVANVGVPIEGKTSESLEMQRMTFLQVVNVNISGKNPTISTVKSIDVKIGDKNVEDFVSAEGYLGIEISKNDGFDKLVVTANYENDSEDQNVEPFSMDVTDEIEIVGYDSRSKESQNVTIKYTYNGITVENTIKVINVEKTVAELEEEKIAKEKATLEEQLKEYADKIKKLQEQHDAYVEELANLNKKNETLVNLINNLQTQIDALTAESEAKIEALEKANVERLSEIEALQQDIATQLEKNAALEAEIKKANEKNASLETKINEVIESNTAIQQEVASTKKTQTILIGAVIAEAVAVVFVALMKKKNSNKEAK